MGGWGGLGDLLQGTEAMDTERGKSNVNFNPHTHFFPHFIIIFIYLCCCITIMKKGSIFDSIWCYGFIGIFLS